MNKPLIKRIALFASLAIAVVFAILVAVQMHTKRQALELLPVNSKMGGDFTLPSTLGRPLDTHNLRGKIVLLDFGFTSCPDVCPLVLARLRQVVKELGESATNVQVVFVSFDPARDTLPNLEAYVHHFNPDFIGATGTEVQIAAIAAHYGVVYLKENSNGSAAGYGFAHSDYTYLIDSQGRVRKLYGSDANTIEIANDIRLLQAADKAFF